MECLEAWKDFLGKRVKVILEDKPSPVPKKKEGVVSEINSTHLILKKADGKPEALRLSDIRRIEEL